MSPFSVPDLTSREKLIFRAGWGAGFAASLGARDITANSIRGILITGILAEWIEHQDWTMTHSKEELEDLLDNKLPKADMLKEEAMQRKLLLVLNIPEEVLEASVRGGNE